MGANGGHRYQTKFKYIVCLWKAVRLLYNPSPSERYKNTLMHSVDNFFVLNTGEETV